MQKIIFSIFTPFLIAVIIRIILFILGLVLYYLFGFSRLGKGIGGFDSFTWDESYLFWVIVGLLTFYVEMLIWDEDNK